MEKPNANNTFRVIRALSSNPSFSALGMNSNADIPIMVATEKINRDNRKFFMIKRDKSGI
tara:strand:- start:289 stop:468 length:180 start_codon:yes stop_codon:yes gene_type:complete